MSCFLSARTFTSLLVIGLCAFTISREATVLRYASAESRADSGNSPEALAPFVDDITVGILARSGLSASMAKEHAAQRVVGLNELVTLSPLMSGAWLELARTRLESHETAEKIVAALLMSHVTGPNEGRLMGERAVFALPLWSMLPAEARKSLITDLVGGWGEVGDPQRQAMCAALAVAREDTREAVGAVLWLSGRQALPVMKALRVQAAGRAADEK